ncbi:hypothetical protein CFC21_022630 [Triticum aestivum]|uniref:DUF6598 domain-containing protein n=2 Tax=Triticum aestivum TaxID=4565 RepID=A0A9R1ECB9_WHEAT|nr:uncharacterized protein LOC123176423 [Triticum aestivum]KAF6987003.1 hypothetical protein CFC21_004678 [Triticum aestivum]KAF7007716.1 hypothetical protein CFC21_022630 [Triticum aestivum]
MYACDSDGQPLVEVFSVRVHGGEAPTGTVSVFDGKRGQIIYNNTPEHPHKPAASSRHRSSGKLPLTGPYRAISADGCVAIVLDLQGRCQNKAAPSPSSSSSSYVSEILVDVYDENTRYDEAITHDDGFLQVRYALLSDAVEAIVEVKLLRPRASGTVRGTVVARTVLGEVVLFDVGETTMSIGMQELTGTLPLARSVVAVQLTSLLTIEVDLRLDGDETMSGSVACQPKPGTKEVRGLAGGEVEVTVTWLD